MEKVKTKKGRRTTLSNMDDTKGYTLEEFKDMFNPEKLGIKPTYKKLN
jgi:hypothetical protein